MLRAIIRRRYKDRATGLETVGHETIDFLAAQLETVLRGGGWAEDGYDVRELVDVEVLAYPSDHLTLDVYGDCKCSVCCPPLKQSSREDHG